MVIARKKVRVSRVLQTMALVQSFIASDECNPAPVVRIDFKLHAIRSLSSSAFSGL